MSAVAARTQDHGRRAIPMQERALRTVAKIEEATREAIALNGVHGFTTSDVAIIAEVSVGVVYRYFPDRLALLEHVYPSVVSTVDQVRELEVGDVVLDHDGQAVQARDGHGEFRWNGIDADGEPWFCNDEELIADGPARVVYRKAVHS